MKNPAVASGGALREQITEQDDLRWSLSAATDTTRPTGRKASAPLARAVGRCVQAVANHAPIAAIIALAVALASYRPRQCFNANGRPKVRHRSREDAIAHKRALILAGRATKWLQVYQCDVCGFWHVGHRGGRR